MPVSKTLAGRYVLEAPIAEGPMAAVWKAQDEVLARTVAVKILHAHLASDESFLGRFRLEAMEAACLSHPHIAQIYDTGSDPVGGDPAAAHFIVLEHCGGGSLDDLMRAGGSLESQEVIELGVAVCEALSWAHSERVLHGDLRPSNILLTDQGVPKVTDFGIARAAFQAGDLDTTGSILGSTNYLAPELGKGREPDVRTDLYALGVVLYELLGGRASGKLGIRAKEDPPPLRSFRGDISKAVDAAICKAIALDPDDRYGSAEEMRAGLLGAMGREGRARTDELPPRRAGGRSPSRSRVVAATAGLLLVGGSLAFALTRLGGEEGSEPRPPGGGRGAPAAVKQLEIRAAGSFDPHGEGEEHESEAPLTIDGDTTTAWTTETYSTPLPSQKPGVGVLLDLGAARSVTKVGLVFGEPGTTFEVRAGDAAAGDEDGFVKVAEGRTDAERTTLQVEASARYWLVWITDLPGGGPGAASIREVTFFGS